jgi:heavy metal translocating P-type ATPase
MSSDEDEFVAKAGMMMRASQGKEANELERALDAVFNATGVHRVADFLRGNAFVAVVSWVLFVVAGISHILMHVGGGGVVETQTAATLSKACTILVYALAGTPEFVDVTYELAVGNVNIHVLTTLAVLGTVLLGCAMEGALLLVLFASAHFVEDRLTSHARGDLKALWGTVPTTADVVTLNSDGVPDISSIREVPAADVEIGTTIFVKAGQQVPLDGVVVHGSALVSIQHITGEALPVMKRYGDEIPAGAMNTDGVLVVKSLRSSEESTPARIARLTEAAQRRRPKVSRLIDSIGDRYSKAILAITFITMLLAPVVLGIPFLGRGGAMYRSFAFLSAAAPCALLMSPLVYVAAIGAMARRGVLIRGGLTLDALAEVGTVALDKTGTITTGQMSCTSITRFDCEKPEQGAPGASLKSLAYALNLERGSSHPIAAAVTASTRGLDLPDVGNAGDYKVVHGSGVEGLFAGKRARFGTAEFALELCGDDAENCSLAINSETRDGEIVAVLAVEGERPALFRFSDTLNSKAPEAAESLRSGRCRRRWWEMADNSKGLELLMLTGDNQTSAKAMAEAIKLAPESVYSGLTPDQKLKLIEDARERKKTSKYPRVAMVGDGINDGPRSQLRMSV